MLNHSTTFGCFLMAAMNGNLERVTVLKHSKPNTIISNTEMNTGMAMVRPHLSPYVIISIHSGTTDIIQLNYFLRLNN